MSKSTVYLLGILGTIFIGCYFYSKFCCNCYPIIKQNLTQIDYKTTEKIDNFFSFKEGNFEYSCDKNFIFSNNSFHFIKPINHCIDNGIYQLKSYFRKNPNGKLDITGYSLSTEKNTSAFPNLGFARANAVKNYFISKGIASSRFKIKGEIKHNWIIERNILLGPIRFSITNDIIDAKGEDWDAIKEKLITNPLVLYFNTNQTEITLTEEERQEIADLNNYLDHNPTAKISCIGYTDSTGDRNVNIQIGQERADFAKAYLIKNGIAENRIEASSKGPDNPIADNLTPEGKAKNRRTIISIQ